MKTTFAIAALLLLFTACQSSHSITLTERTSIGQVLYDHADYEEFLGMSGAFLREVNRHALDGSSRHYFRAGATIVIPSNEEFQKWGRQNATPQINISYDPTLDPPKAPDILLEK